MHNYTAAVFWRSGWAKAQASTPEECLRDLEKQFNAHRGDEACTLTFKPEDGTIYCDEFYVPCGIVFKVQ
jgi:hypothetical protein